MTLQPNRSQVVFLKNTYIESRQVRVINDIVHRPFVRTIKYYTLLREV